MNVSYKNIIVSLFVVAWFFPSTARLQPYLGTKTPYPSPSKNKITPPPAGYEPVFINYTGRHGSRFMTKAGSDVEVLALLSYAKKKNALTSKGKQLKAMTERFLTIEKDNYENITLLGSAEQEAIGTRIFSTYQKAFKGQGIDVIMTHKVRTQQSAEAFRKGLKNYPGAIHEKVIPDSADNTLRFYDIAPAYRDFKKSTPLVKRMDSLSADARAFTTAKNVCSKLFSPDFVQTLLKEGVVINAGKKNSKINAISFTDNLYDLYTISFSMPLEMKQKGYAKSDIDFSIAFDEKDLRWLDLVNGASDFYEKGAGLDTLGLQIRIAVPLLADYLNSTQDIIINKRKADGVFRFTHAEAISPLATLLGIREASVPDASVFSYHKNWKASSIIPLSANIAWIVYSNGKDQLVKVLLNEKEVRLPITTHQYPFYRWEDIRNYYLKKISALHTDPQADMQQYLLNVK